MKLLLPGSILLALTVPLAVPASAGQSPSATRLSVGARSRQPRAGTLGAAATFRKLHAHAKAKTAHFSFPYGLATDAVGDVFVANLNSNSIAEINTKLKVTADVITQQLQYPISVAVGPLGNVYVGNLGTSGGYVTEYSGSTPQATITANTIAPYSIAVDQFSDLYVLLNGGIATDDPYGNALYGSAYASYNIVSVNVGNADVSAFFNGDWLTGNGSVFLRTGALQSIVGPSGSASPVGSVCAVGVCWYSDAANNAIFLDGNAAAVQYSPAGVAYDQLHNRLFVADPINNAVHVYNAQTLAVEKTLI